MAVVLSDEEYALARGSKEGFEAVLTRVCALAVEDALRVLPQVVKSLVVQVAGLKETSDFFYKSNPDMASRKEELAKVLESLEAQNPGKPYPELIQQAANQLRARVFTGVDPGGKPKLEDLDKQLNGMFQ